METEILDAIDRWCEREVAPHVMALEHGDIWPEKMVAQMKALGLFGATISPQYGGLGLPAGLYARIVTREPVPGALRDRVTKLLASGGLEENVGLRLDHDRSRIMLCGNPEMVEDSRGILTARGFRISRRGDPGHLAVENYW